jgi:hypothetical protein
MPHDMALYASERWGHFSYAVPVAEGRYRVTLNSAKVTMDVVTLAWAGLAAASLTCIVTVWRCCGTLTSSKRREEKADLSTELFPASDLPPRAKSSSLSCLSKAWPV